MGLRSTTIPGWLLDAAWLKIPCYTSSVCLELVLLQIIHHNVCTALWCWWVGQLNQWMAPGGAFLQVTSAVLMFHALDDKQPGVAWLRTGRLEEEVTWLRLHQWHGSEIDRSHAMTQLQLPYKWVKLFHNIIIVASLNLGKLQRASGFQSKGNTEDLQQSSLDLPGYCSLLLQRKLLPLPLYPWSLVPGSVWWN